MSTFSPKPLLTKVADSQFLPFVRVRPEDDMWEDDVCKRLDATKERVRRA